MTKKIFDLDLAQKYVGVSRPTLLKLAKPCFKINRRSYFKLSDLKKVKLGLVTVRTGRPFGRQEA